MKTPDDATYINVAGEDATVGAQIGRNDGDITVHFGDRYEVGPDDPPEKKVVIGTRYLEAGDPAEARALIEGAVMNGYVTSKVLFYWALSILSRRVPEQLEDADLRSLRTAFDRRRNFHDGWAHALQLVERIFSFSLAGGRGERDSRDGEEASVKRHRIVKELGSLLPEQAEAIRQHMEFLIDGAIEDELYEADRKEVQRAQIANGRVERAWKFFQAHPARPRVYHVRKPQLPLHTRLAAGVGAATLSLGFGWLLSVLLWQPTINTLLVVTAFAGGGCLALRYGIQWRCGIEQRRTLDRVFRYPARDIVAPPGGFTHKVTEMFERYARKYAPPGVAGQVWLRQTAGIRRWLRDEVLHVYRESGINARAVAWLIRHYMYDLRVRWQDQSLWDDYTRLEVPLWKKIATLGAIVVTAIGALGCTVSAILVDPQSALPAVPLMIAGGTCTLAVGNQILREDWRYRLERDQSNARKERAEKAYQKWCAKLADRPSDDEMEAWLDADRRAFKYRVMEAYRLRPRDIVTYTFYEHRSDRRCKAARVGRRGPVRYSRYRLLIYLLTKAGIRQATTELDFYTGSFEGDRRTSFRYDAIASVEVASHASRDHRVRLMLVNGEPADVTLPEQSVDTTEGVPHSEALVIASGLGSTLRILENVAAEGKDWLEQHRNRRRNALALVGSDQLD